MMKNLVVLFLCFCVSMPAWSQGSFWGTTYGLYGDGGRIYRFDQQTGDVTYLKTFGMVDGDGRYSHCTPIVGSDNKLYGTTAEGGLYTKGVLYSINQSTLAYTKLFDFPYHIMDSYDQGPFGKLIEGPDGFLYGYRDLEEPKIYKIRKDGTGYSELTTPWPIKTASDAGLIRANDGNIYGISTSDVHPGGFIFKFTTAGAFTKTYTFTTGRPSHRALQSSDGKLYGTFIASTLFRINLDGSNIETFDAPLVDKRFDPGIIEGPGSMLYGVIRGGTTHSLYKIATNFTGFTVLHEFDANLVALGSLAVEGAFVYGVTSHYDEVTRNKVYKIGTDGSNFTVIKQLSAETGWWPGGICLGANQTLFAANGRGASGTFGSIVKLKTDGSQFSIVKDFYTEVDGQIPGAHLELLPNGEILGAAAAGGTLATDGFISGVLFKIKTDDTYEVIFEFDGDNTGATPLDAPIPGPGGFYYGATERGGANDQGVIYKIKSDGTGFQKLHDFDTPGGAHPWAGLTLADGRLYGWTTVGGSNDLGVIFGIDPDGSDYDEILAFDGDNGYSPLFQKLVYRNNGFLYGCTDGGLSGSGIFFRVRPNGTEYSILFDLGETDFVGPYAEPLFLPNGDILVVATRGGTKDRGAIIRLTNGGSSFSIAHEFDVTFAGDADVVINGSLTLGPDGLVYGLEPNGGSEGTGTAFKMNPDGSNYTRIELNLDGNPVGYMTPWRGLLYDPNVAAEKLSQTINFDELDPETIHIGDVIKLHATASSGLPVTFSTPSTNVDIIYDLAGVIGPGRVTIIAEQEGNVTYKPADPVEQSFCIYPSKPVITTGGNEFAPVLTSSNDNGNQWYRDGTLIADAINESYSVTENGSYTVKTTADDCASALSESVNVTVVVVGLGEESGFIRIFPNPATKEIFVKTTQASFISILDVTGRMVDQRQALADEERFDVSSFSKGLYILRVETPEAVTTRTFSKL